jgi:hypothetical protein
MQMVQGRMMMMRQAMMSMQTEMQEQGGGGQMGGGDFGGGGGGGMTNGGGMSGGGGKACFAFQKGECRFGDDCRYSHEGEGSCIAGAGGMSTCFAWQKGECTFGDKCRYAHDGDGGLAPGANAGGGDRACFAYLKAGAYTPSHFRSTSAYLPPYWSLLCPCPLNLSLLCLPYNPNWLVNVTRRCSS